MNILDWNGVTTGMLVVLCIIGITMNYVIFNMLDGNNKKIQYYIDAVQNFCVKKCSNDYCSSITKLRDEKYYTYGDGDSKSCLITSWEISHLLFHVFIGYFYNIYISTVISVGYEIYEHYDKLCGSYLDLGYNMTGFLIGNYLKSIYCI
jgi:hypothetical protein